MSERNAFKALLFSGMRFVEARRWKAEWLQGGFIHIPRGAMRKKKCLQLERWVRLNPLGEAAVRDWSDMGAPLPSQQTWGENLKRWAAKASLDPRSLCAKSTRKTWESWLVFCYPAQTAAIFGSQGHTATTALTHYVNMPFTEAERPEMMRFAGGWI
jgi:hypothetical protein